MTGTQSRSYDSPLRAEQRERTRQRIVDAATGLLADERLEELTIPLVARRAGVSVRTVYVHFATKDDLIEAVSRDVDATIGAIEYPADAEELPAFAVRVFAAFQRDEQLFRAAMNSRAGREVRARGRARRILGLEQALEPELVGLSPLERRQVVAMLYTVHGMPAWLALRDHGLDGEQAGRAAAWAVRALLRELRERPASIREEEAGAARAGNGATSNRRTAEADRGGQDAD